MPQYVYLAFAVAAVTLPLALWMPPPRVSSQVAGALCLRLMGLGLLGLAASAVLVLAFNVWFGAMATTAASLVAFHVMFWFAAPARRDDGEDEDGDGGSRRPGPPPGPRGPSGIDWDEFDRHRRGWETDRARRGRELMPA